MAQKRRWWRLTPEKVVDIRKRLENKEKVEAIAQELGVSVKVVNNIRRGDSYRFVG